MEQDLGSGFQEPEFYDSENPVATVSGPYGSVTIFCEGESLAEFNGRWLETPKDFLETFPDGQIPTAPPFDDPGPHQVTWHRSKRFELYDMETGKHLDTPTWTLAEAIREARWRVEMSAEWRLHFDLEHAASSLWMEGEI